MSVVRSSEGPRLFPLMGLVMLEFGVVAGTVCGGLDSLPYGAVQGVMLPPMLPTGEDVLIAPEMRRADPDGFLVYCSQVPV